MAWRSKLLDGFREAHPVMDSLSLVALFWVLIGTIASICGVPWKSAFYPVGIQLTVLALWLFVPVSWYEHFLPERFWTRALALLGYFWPIQWQLVWFWLGWPVLHRGLVSAIGGIFGLIGVCTLAWLVRTSGSGGWQRKALSTTCIALAMLLQVLLPVVWVYVGGLVALAQTPQVLEQPTPDTPIARGVVEVVHLSDLHLTGDRKRPTFEGNAPGEALFPVYAEHVRAMAPQLVMVTGDITDAGEAEQWKHAAALLKPLSQERSVILAPGNHDLSGAYTEDRIMDPNRRMVAFLELQALLNDRVASHEGRPLRALFSAALPTREAVEAERRRRKEAAAAATIAASDPVMGPSPWFAVQEELRNTLEGVRWDMIAAKLPSLDCFPLQWHAPGGRAHVFVLNSSIPPSARLGRSAVGSFGQVQVRRLRALVAPAAQDPRTRTILILSHHAVSRPATGVDFATLFNFGLLHLRPDDSLAILKLAQEIRRQRPDIQWMVCYGHRHEKHLGELADLRVVEAPNLRDQGDAQRGFWFFSRTDTGLQVAWESILPHLR